MKILANPTADIRELEAQLRSLELTGLRNEWLQRFPDRAMPTRLSRDLLVRSILQDVQEKRFGGLGGDARRTLRRMAEQLAGNGCLAIEREMRPKAGTRLIREWKGRTYIVEIIDDGVRHEGRDYGSLSEVAREITGTRWSGPRFFGLKQPEPSARDR